MKRVLLNSDQTRERNDPAYFHRVVPNENAVQTMKKLSVGCSQLKPQLKVAPKRLEKPTCPSQHFLFSPCLPFSIHPKAILDTELVLTFSTTVSQSGTSTASFLSLFSSQVQCRSEWDNSGSVCSPSISDFLSMFLSMSDCRLAMESVVNQRIAASRDTLPYAIKIFL